MSATIFIFPVIPNISGVGRQSQRQRECDEPMRNIQFRARPRLVVDNVERRREPRRRVLPSVFVNRAGS